MRERGISYSPEMVLARKAGIKTQTRRIAKINVPKGFNLGFSGIEAHHLGDGRWALMSRGEGGAWQERAHAKCPYGVVGDRLYVREAYRFERGFDDLSPGQVGESCLDAGYASPWAPIRYEADGATRNWKMVGTPTREGTGGPLAGRYRHARFMPRWASRGVDGITNVRLQPLWCISEEDAIAEGIEPSSLFNMYRIYGKQSDGCDVDKPRVSYCSLWEHINGDGSWMANPWVWAITFRKLE
jgi:hypothetical protein